MGFFSCLLCLTFAFALVSASGKEIVLTKKNFAQVFEPGKPWIVKCYAPWCGHCKSMAPAYEALAAKIQGLVGVASVNCDEEKELCGMLQIKGFPTLKLFGATPNKKGTKDADDYQGARTTAAMASAVLNLLDAKNIQIAKKDNIKTMLADKKAAVLFAAKSEPSNLFKSLSMQFGKRLSFVLSADKEAAAAFDVKTFPTLIVTDNGEKVEAYAGKPNIEDMITFLEKFAVPKPQKKSEQPEKEAPPAPKVEYDKVVSEITTEEQWNTKCDVKAGFCGVAMLDPEEEGGEERHKKFLSTLDGVVQKLFKNMRVMWVNAPKHMAFYEKFNLGGGFPAFALYSPKLKRVVPYRGSFTVEDIHEWFTGRVLLNNKVQSAEVKDLQFK